ncbi:hypothetical protein Pen01_31160 [Phytomonospora endophytica]|nr:hypothetical protein Pen01_31160 [Phytomonospora endophytica]
MYVPQSARTRHQEVPMLIATVAVVVAALLTCTCVVVLRRRSRAK